MKNFRILSVLVAALAMVSVANAQQPAVKADVPFNFVLGDKIYPAGEYTLQRLTQASPAWKLDETAETKSAMTISPCCTMWWIAPPSA